jgi:lipoprotein signal peptidase
MGVVGSIAWSLYLKKSSNYKLTIRAIPTVTLILTICICILLSQKATTILIFIFGGAIGFSSTPILPISYDLGC